jgi:hypothetical protein
MKAWRVHQRKSLMMTRITRIYTRKTGTNSWVKVESFIPLLPETSSNAQPIPDNLKKALNSSKPRLQTNLNRLYLEWHHVLMVRKVRLFKWQVTKSLSSFSQSMVQLISLHSPSLIICRPPCQAKYLEANSKSPTPSITLWASMGYKWPKVGARFPRVEWVKPSPLNIPGISMPRVEVAPHSSFSHLKLKMSEAPKTMEVLSLLRWQEVAPLAEVPLQTSVPT